MRPQYRRFGFVDFDAMATLPSSDDADEFVCRRANGDNVLVTRADIIAGSGVTFPLLAPDGLATAPSYSFASEPNTGVFLDAGGGSLDFAAIGIHTMQMDDTGLFSGQVANSAYVISDTSPSATIPVHAFAGDPDTGLGTAGDDILSIIAGGIEISRAVEVVGANQFIVAPGVIQNNAAAPSLALGSGNMGFYQSTINNLIVSIAGTGRFLWETDGTFLFRGSSTGAPTMVDLNASATVPVFVFQNDRNTGLGSATPDQLNLIAGGLTCMSVSEVGGARRIGFYEGSPIALQTGVAVTTAAVHAALVALRLITA